MLGWAIPTMPEEKPVATIVFARVAIVVGFGGRGSMPALRFAMSERLAV
jgi:hypothetical protein